MTAKTRKIAVLTGDLVGSTALGPAKVEQAFDALEACAEMQADWMDGQSLHFTRHRGDGWQVALAEPKYALRSALCFRASLKALGKEFDSYIGIAEGDAALKASVSLNNATDEVFVKSGRELEYARTDHSESRMHFTRHHRHEPAILLLDLIFGGWTPTQAATMKTFLAIKSGRFLSDIAEELGKSRQSVTKTLKAAGYEHIQEALLLVELEHRHA